MNWLELYRRGQRELVWHELRQLGSAAREPGHFEEAQLVCDEMATRARQNIEVIVELLASAGYRFHSNDGEQRPAAPYVPRRRQPWRLPDGWKNASAPSR